MPTVEFETEIVDDTIHIPEELKGSLPRKARVVITDGAPPQGGNNPPPSRKNNVLTLNQISEAVKTVAPQYDISQVYLFGSYARGEATEVSDVDFRIVGGNMRSLFDLGGLYEDLAEPLGGIRIGLVQTKNMSEKFYSNIKDEEILIYAGQ